MTASERGGFPFLRPERPWFLTRHALQRMTEMGLTRPEVVAVLREADVSWPSYLGRRVAAGGDIAAVFDPRNRAVVTILWHTEEQWARESPPPSPERAQTAA